MAKEKMSVESLVNEALRKLATADGPMKLTGKGDPPALFASAAGTNKDAVAQLTDASNPLLRTAGKNDPVKLTAAGFARALPTIPEERVGPLAKDLATDIPTAAARIAFLQQIVDRTPLATAELLPVLEEAAAAERAETEARLASSKKHRDAEEASRKAIVRWLEVQDERRKDRIAALLKELEIEGAKADPPRPSPAATQPPAAKSAPATAAERSFCRDTADQLTTAWRAAWDDNKAEARDYLESAIWNISGLRAVGEVGQKTTFDGRLHEGAAGLFTGDAVNIVRPGWVLEEDEDREYVALKAVVEK